MSRARLDPQPSAGASPHPIAPLAEEKPRERARRAGKGVAVSAERISKSFLLIDEGDAFRIAFGAAKGVKRFEALKDVTLRAPKGEFVGVLGPNGAGKTTLLRTIGGVYSPDEGVVTVNGTLGAIYELGVAGNPFLTGRQYAERMLLMRGLPSRDRRALLEDIFEFSELGDRLDDRIQGYSTGMAARLYFAVATAGAYDVYLIDEVLAVGDQYFQAKCWRRLRQRLENGASGVLVTHDWSTIVKVCREAHILEKGRIVHSGPPDIVVRRHLFGEELGQPIDAGVARILGRPEGPIVARQGARLSIAFDAEVLRDERVTAVAAVERLKPGAGWEVMVMSRDPVVVATARGRYRVEMSMDAVRLPPGDYVLGASLIQRRPGEATARIFDRFGWLNGTGVPLRVEGEAVGSALPARFEWRRP